MVVKTNEKSHFWHKQTQIIFGFGGFECEAVKLIKTLTLASFMWRDYPTQIPKWKQIWNPKSQIFYFWNGNGRPIFLEKLKKINTIAEVEFRVPVVNDKTI